MNYITEILAFQGFAQDKSLSSGQIALWYALMYINNRCQWQEWFTVANKSLESNSGLSRQGIVKARNALKQLGLIDFKASGGAKATAYKMITMSKSVSDNISDSVQSNIQSSIQNSIQSGVHSCVPNSSTLNKQNKNKQEKNKFAPPGSPSLLFFQSHVGSLNPTVERDINSFLEQGVEEALIIKAIQKAVDKDIRRWSYIKGTLNSLIAQGIMTAAAWENEGRPKYKNTPERQSSYDIELFEQLGCQIPEFPEIKEEVKLRIPNEC